jgi:hypothetical protein
LALNLSNVDILGVILVYDPAELWALRPRSGKRVVWCKLELFHYLVQTGWDLVDVARFYEEGGANRMVAKNIYGPTLYFRCLILSPMIFAKPGRLKKIWHNGPQAYYAALLQLHDLSLIAGLTDEELFEMTQDNFKALVKGGGRRPRLDVAEGGEESSGDDGNDGVDGVPRLPHPVVPLPPRPGMPAVPLVPVIETFPPIDSTLAAFEPMRVLFDKMSHQTGNVRCYTTCKKHVNCRQYVFVKDFPSKEHAVSHLFAWRIGAEHFPPIDEGLHIAHKPSAALVENVYRQQFAGM